MPKYVFVNIFVVYNNKISICSGNNFIPYIFIPDFINKRHCLFVLIYIMIMLFLNTVYSLYL